MAIQTIDITSAVARFASFSQALVSSAVRNQLTASVNTKLTNSSTEMGPGLASESTNDSPQLSLLAVLSPVEKPILFAPQALTENQLLSPARSVSLAELISGDLSADTTTDRTAYSSAALEIVTKKTYSAAELMLSSELKFSHRQLDTGSVSDGEVAAVWDNFAAAWKLTGTEGSKAAQNSSAGLPPFQFRDGISQSVASGRGGNSARFQSEPLRHPVFKRLRSKRPDGGSDLTSAADPSSAGLISRFFNKLTRN